MPLEHRTAQVGSIRMHYVVEGSGPLVVLLHRFPEFWSSWRFQISPLVQAGYRVAAPALPAYNETDRTGAYDLDTLAGDVAAIVAALGESRATIVGHDWGGAITWHLATSWPQLCDRIVVLNAPHPAVFARALRRSLRQLRRSWYIFFFQLPRLPERRLLKDWARLLGRMYRANAVDRSHFTDKDVPPFRSPLARPGVATAALGYYRAAFRRMLQNRRTGERYTQIDCPTLR